MEEKITSELLENYEIALVERELAVLTSTIPDESKCERKVSEGRKKGEKVPWRF